MTPKQPLVEVNNLSFHRGQRAIFSDISLTIEPGKVTAIMGPSGIGKTTLLKLLAGQLKPDAGRVLFDGHDINALSRRELYKLRRRMSMLFQSGALFTDMSVLDNVAFPLREHANLPEELIRKLALMKLQAVGLRGAAQLMPSELSGGMQRRAALARAIALEPELVMFDEPFAGQDPISMGVLVKLIKDLSQALHLTSVVVSHDVEEVLSIADYAYVIADQRIIAQGTPQELKDNPDPHLAQFMQGRADGPVPFHMSAPDYQQELK
ncbi:phospholipid ABC transporter ATP-binding protein MlaF [Paraferrimonas sedimenticola]|uniref:ABC transporter ATP-binding protein n=1 Tax=Paraferrimonas sedimenticola TaxID=375674 RepID=A0AA37RUX1_9GAMM|nr:phospholipid ABC transporter ATP-binding protein MlaF [Paraferrimonas sedimenticola]GLP95824.1 ABC transporter ATP-binding protein [Paraferrimonas sedimenticola]